MSARRETAVIANRQINTLFGVSDEPNTFSDKSEMQDEVISNNEETGESGSELETQDFRERQSNSMTSKNRKEIWSSLLSDFNFGQPRRHNILREGKGPSR